MTTIFPSELLAQGFASRLRIQGASNIEVLTSDAIAKIPAPGDQPGKVEP